MIDITDEVLRNGFPLMKITKLVEDPNCYLCMGNSDTEFYVKHKLTGMRLTEIYDHPLPAAMQFIDDTFKCRTGHKILDEIYLTSSVDLMKQVVDLATILGAKAVLAVPKEN